MEGIKGDLKHFLKEQVRHIVMTSVWQKTDFSLCYLLLIHLSENSCLIFEIDD